jgi:chloramphenicol O-acetyltransferase type A
VTFHLIDLDTYSRKDHFEHFLNRVPCTYSATVPIDVTRLRVALKEKGLKAYPAQIYLLTTAVNYFPEFRMSLDGDRRLGYWERASPLYTVLSPDTKTFSGIWTPYDENFASFYRACIADIDRYGNGAFMPQADQPANLINISSIPWLDFTAFNLNLTPNDYLLPIFTIGKYIERDGTTQMPLAIQVHHAVCDGYHLGQFVEHVRHLANTFEDWLNI